MVSKLRGVENGVVTEEDVVRSIKTLQPLGAGYEVIDVGNGKKMVRSVVKELDEDQATVLAEAQTEGGRVVEETLVTRAGWTRERARAALENMLLRDGLCWLDAQDEQHGKAYWVPSAMSPRRCPTSTESAELQRTKGQIRKLFTPKSMEANIEFNEIVMTRMSHSFDAHRSHGKTTTGSAPGQGDTVPVEYSAVFLPALLQVPAQLYCADGKTFRLVISVFENLGMHYIRVQCVVQAKLAVRFQFGVK
ncbi:hypothetical protein PISMIDRAFT_24084 [Pisolithus microcarpus 441]|uniref:Vacuolar-sorting protein SNF8 n=1 Tax=Pisolithus microcarpus 441 TaxID=765257 RepID=A0A0C9Z3E9_9AGAM|nr:hypothetical protein PISMIDRAFT_24084 [Pisolithus microcarpus 441]